MKGGVKKCLRNWLLSVVFISTVFCFVSFVVVVVVVVVFKENFSVRPRPLPAKKIIIRRNLLIRLRSARR